MSMRFMRFKDGREKALTLSYDDGVDQDKRLVEILDKYGIKGTFNISSDMIGKTGAASHAMDAEDIVKTYKPGGHEIAIHGHTHPYLEELASNHAVYEVIENRRVLEKIWGGMVRGCAYPFGTYSDEVVEILKLCGIKYARTAAATHGFKMPEDWLRMPATCHHNDDKLFSLADEFLNHKKQIRKPWLFYLWGHSYEFDVDNNWDRIEKFCETVGKRDDIWYATNIEIYDYAEAYRSLQTSADGTMIYNPTRFDVWFYDDTVGGSYNGDVYCVKSGETITIKD